MDFRNNINIRSLIVTNVSLIVTLITGETGCGLHGNSVYHLLNLFCKSKTVQKNKMR